MGRGGGSGGGGGGGSGGGGGGRSFGGRSSGSRSFGHVSGSSRGGSSRGGSSSGRGGGLSGGGFSNRSNSRTFIYAGGGSRSYGGRYGSGYRRPGSVAAAATVVCVIIIVVFWLLISRVLLADSAPPSTYQREPLAEGIALETDYLKDDANWIDNVSMVERAMKYFYDKTGVFPYLWIADSVDGRTSLSDSEAEAALGALYDAEIGDEGHIAILFFEPHPDNYDIYYLAGTAARSVLDQEAVDILMNYFEQYYYGDYDDNEYFSEVFTDAADRIMTKTTPTSRILLIAAIALVALISLFLFTLAMAKKVNERKRLNAEILNTPIDESDAFDIEDEADKAAKKYDE
ncbi:MAG: hypothetical protein LBP30_08985 [Clostridiales Family XIII bacterium]|nr:hypothetical protein [Clostridiales Family XIII bacterium]